MAVSRGNLASSAVVLAPSIQTPAVQIVQSRSASGFWLAMGANVLWGTSFLASKFTLQVWGPITASVLRFAVALLVMALVFPLMGYRIRIPRTRGAIRTVALVGLTGFGLLYPLQLLGLKMVTTGLSSAIMLTSPLFVLLLAAGLLREGLSARKLGAVAIGLVGGTVTLVSNGATFGTELSAGLLGGLLTLGASACLAASVIATRRSSGEMDSANLTFWSTVVGLVLLAPVSLFESHVALNSIETATLIRAGGALAYLAIVCSAFCFVVWNKAISLSPAKEVATTMHIKTPVAVILGAWFAQEALSPLMLFGAGLVAFGVWLSQSEKTEARRG